MTSTEKRVNELIEMFNPCCKEQHQYFNRSEAIKCSLDCVDEILELDIHWHHPSLVEDYPSRYESDQTMEFWQEVKSILINKADTLA